MRGTRVRHGPNSLRYVDGLRRSRLARFGRFSCISCVSWSLPRIRTKRLRRSATPSGLRRSRTFAFDFSLHRAASPPSWAAPVFVIFVCFVVFTLDRHEAAPPPRYASNTSASLKAIGSPHEWFTPFRSIYGETARNQMALIRHSRYRLPGFFTWRRRRLPRSGLASGAARSNPPSWLKPSTSISPKKRG